MRAYQIFARMEPPQAEALLGVLAKESPQVFAQSLAIAGAVMKARPVYLRKQPFEKRAAAIRRALARVSSNLVAEEVLATYFLECRRGLLTEWLDLLGLEHEDGALKDGAPAAPDDEALATAIEKLRASASEADGADRELLMRAFAAQSAIDWPALDAALANDA